jgi:UDP-glucose 4-epimerase
MTRTSLVTGGAGFIGSHLVEALLERGRRVLVLDDLSTGNATNLDSVRGHPRLRVVLDSVANPQPLADLLDEADEIFHLAAVVGVQLVLERPERTVAANVSPTEWILRRLERSPKPFFLASTSEVYGKSDKFVLGEDDDLILGPPTVTRWIYACGKALDEYLALAHHRRSGLPVVVGRFFNVVGPRQVGRYGMVLPRFVDQALTGGPLVVHDDGQQVRCFAHVADVVEAAIALMDCPEAVGQVFNIGNDEPITIRALAELIVREVDPSLAIQHIAYSAAFPPGFEDIRRRVPDLTRLRRAIDYRPRHDLTSIVRETIAWRREQLRLPCSADAP